MKDKSEQDKIRNEQEEKGLKQLEEENPRLIKQILELKEQLENQKKQLENQKKQLEDALSLATKWQAAYEDLKQRALKAYYEQQAEIERLKKDR